MPRRVLLLILAILVIASPALARPTDAEEAQTLLATLASGAKDQREAAAARLIELGPHVIPELEAFLNRTRTSKVADRREVLKKIKASIPDKSGRFTSPGREEAKQIRADDEFDWFVPLFALDPAIPGVGDVIADVVAIRALAATKDVDAARIILAAAFADESMIYRDDCGRQMRKMVPFSVPALIVGSQNKKIKTMPKYANYQLERMDRQDPHKALAAGEGNEALQIAILQAFGSTEHREAVPAVFTMINADAPRIRAAAREAWLAYVTGPPPPPAPKKHLVLPGGRTADKETPLWLNSRELAFVELQRRAEELFGETIGAKADLEVVTKRIFDYYDAERARRDDEVYTSGKTKADAGDLPGAIAIYDRLLAEDPGRKERTAMAPIYFEQAEALAAEAKWAEAAALYSKAHGLDPDRDGATDILAAHYYALGKAAEAEGKDGAASFRKAVELRPDYADAQQAAEAATPGAKPAKKQWMLYAAAGVALGALIVLALGLRRRRA